MRSKAPIKVAGFERGERPMDDWSQKTNFSMCSRPVMESCAPGSFLELWKCLPRALARMLLMRVDFPEPEGPEMTTTWWRGISTVRLLRLCSRAPTMVILDFEF